MGFNFYNKQNLCILEDNGRLIKFKEKKFELIKHSL